MTIRSLTHITDPTLSISGELCVIGAGIAGLLLATRIARSGRKVIVLESGKDHHDPDIQFMNAVEDDSARYGRELSGRYRGLGGTSSRWGGRMIPISKLETGNRPHIREPAWPIKIEEIDKYSEEIERLFGIANGPFEDIGNPRHAKGIGVLPNAILGLRWAKCPTFKNCNLATLFKKELKENSNLEIWLDSTVCDFGFDRGSGRLKTITAKNLTGKSLTVHAQNFVLAAGTIETTRLLLFMDRLADGKIFGAQSVVGHFFQDHLKVEVAQIERRDAELTNRYFGYRFVRATRRDLHLELGHEAQIESGTGSAFAYIAMDLGQSPLAGIRRILQGLQHRKFDVSDFYFIPKNTTLLAKAIFWRCFRKQLFIPGEVDLKVMLCAEQLPNWDNVISLGQSTDTLGVPKAQLKWRPMESEERTLRTAVSQLAFYWKKTGLDLSCPLAWTKAASDWSVPLVAQSVACAHPSGTTKMGLGHKTSIVAPDLHCHAVPNLSIVSASTFPTAGSANPTFTIMKLAYFFADHYLSKG